MRKNRKNSRTRQKKKHLSFKHDDYDSSSSSDDESNQLSLQEIELEQKTSLLDEHSPEALESQQARKQKESWGHWFGRQTVNGVKVTGAIVTAAGTATNALFMLSGKTGTEVAKIGLNVWWGSMSLTQKIFSPLMALAAEDVNARLNWAFFSEFWDRIKTSLSNARKDPKEAVNAILSLILGIGGAVGMGFITYEATQAFGLLTCLTFTGATFAVFAISRYLGINKLISRILNSDITALQEEIIEKINHLKPEQRKELENIIEAEAAKLIDIHDQNGDWKNNASQQSELNAKDFEKLLIEAGRKLDEFVKANPECINETTNSEKAAKYTQLLFQYTFAAYIFSTSFPTFTQKGFKGMEAIFNWVNKLAHSDINLENLNEGDQIAIGLTNITSSILYGISAFDFVRLLTDTSKYLYQNPGQIGWFAKDLIEQVTAAAGMYNVGTNLPGNNIFNIPKNDVNPLLFGLSNGAGGLIVNINPALKKYSHSAKVNVTDPTIQDVVHRFQNPAVTTMSRDTAKELQKFSLFQPKPTGTDTANTLELKDTSTRYVPVSQGFD